ncbi:uncharacterized protein L201_007220 [Kwoniella dendrophila CBS 6074]|uniref:YDG domain-containing protein n=1 Tax=Kwoniella dendrophila CBS 6074 TaxID=1295534 RepID=A0AAX4K3E3_9TREE
MSLSYEEQRVQNIKDNEALLLSLGLGAPTGPKVLKKVVPKKKKDTDIFKPEITSRPARIQKSFTIDDVETPDSVSSADGRRRSTRASARNTPNYSGDTPLWKEDVVIASISGSIKRSRQKDDEDDPESDEEDRWRQRKAQKLGIRTQDPKTFGHIPGVEVGRCWPTRMECSTDAIHAPTVAGISGNAEDGAWSVALSGGYPDDVDLGYAFTYTGCGGRDLKGTKQNPKNLRTAEQTYDQSFDHRYNAALKKSSETRKPVRVIRGFKLTSVYSPVEGYRYDGLYIVEKAWMAKGLTKGLMVCRYAFKRIEGQPDLPVRSMEDEEEAEELQADQTEVKPEQDQQEEVQDILEEKEPDQQDGESAGMGAKNAKDEDNICEGEEGKQQREEEEVLQVQAQNTSTHRSHMTIPADETKEQQSTGTLGKAIRTFRKVLEVVIPTRRKSAGKEHTATPISSVEPVTRRTSLRRSATKR